MILSLPAFFLVKNAIERDVQTGVGQIIATTPITRWMYTMGKMWSNFIFLMSMPLQGDLLTYDWTGVHWTMQMFLERYIWLALAVVIVAVASIFFHRFDLTRSSKINKRGKQSGLRKAEPHIKPVHMNDSGIKLTPYTNIQGQSHYIRILVMELRLMLKGLPLWWYLIAMGTNETYHRTHQLMFTAMHPVRNQFIGLWLAGIIVAYLTGSGAMIRFLVAGEWESLMAMAVGGLFVPTLALALEVWSRNGKLFQVIFMLMWYLGPLNKLEVMDFMGASQQSHDQGLYWYYLLATAILLMLAVIGRVRQVKIYTH